MEPDAGVSPEVVDLSQVNLAVLLEDMESVCTSKAGVSAGKNFLWCSRATLGYNSSTKTSSVVNKSKSSLESIHVAANAAQAPTEAANPAELGGAGRGAEIEKKLNCTLDDLMHSALKKQRAAGNFSGGSRRHKSNTASTTVREPGDDLEKADLLDDDDNDSTCGLVNIGSYSSFNMCENPSDLWFGLKMSDGTPVVINSRNNRPSGRRRGAPVSKREFSRKAVSRRDFGLRDVRRRRHSGPIDYSRGFLSLSKYINHV